MIVTLLGSTWTQSSPSLNFARKPRVFIGLISSMLSLLVVSNTCADSCLPISVKESFRVSDVVYSGKVIRQSEPETIGKDIGNEYTEIEFAKPIKVEFEVDQIWKGEGETSKTTVSSSYPFDTGESYVVFAWSSKVKGERTSPFESLYSGACSNNKKLDQSLEAKALLKELEELKAKVLGESADENSDQSEDVEES